MSDANQLTVITVREQRAPTKPSKAATRGAGHKIQRRTHEVVEQAVETGQLHEALQRFFDGVRKMVDLDAQRIGHYVLDEITFSAEIGADGEFKLLGTGVGVSASSGLTFKLRRSEPAAAAPGTAAP